MIFFARRKTFMGFRQGPRFFRTLMSREQIYEGVFAVHKPQNVSSADVLRHLQKHFNPSRLFRPWIEAERARRKELEGQGQQRRRRKKSRQVVEVKIGHGGTLDPLATGVLIAGIGSGTKHLPDFLGCTKTYETVVLFGAETDTYDRLGKIVRRAPYEHLTREVVEKALRQFRGEIMQRPPIFSALRVQGKKLYEYAREGKEPPVEIKPRPVTVSHLEILDWYEPGTHNYQWPKEEMAGDEKAVAERMLDKDASLPVGSETNAAAAAIKAEQQASPSASKRKSPPGSPRDEDPDLKRRRRISVEEEERKEKASETVVPAPAPAPAPAVKLTMTVSSGFYVRSFAHDLGKAVSSCGVMSSLVRSRQGGFTLDDPNNVLEYRDLDSGEETWGPKVRRFLEDWQAAVQRKQQA